METRGQRSQSFSVDHYLPIDDEVHIRKPKSRTHLSHNLNGNNENSESISPWAPAAVVRKSKRQVNFPSYRRAQNELSIMEIDHMSNSAEQNPQGSPSSTQIEEITLNDDSEIQEVESPSHLYLYRKHIFQHFYCWDSWLCVGCLQKAKSGILSLCCHNCHSRSHFECLSIVLEDCSGDKRLPYVDSVTLPCSIQYCFSEIECQLHQVCCPYLLESPIQDAVAFLNNFSEEAASITVEETDTAVLCTAVKTFFHSLWNPLIPPSMRDKLVAVTEVKGKISYKHIKILMTLPEETFRTLCLVVLHLKKVIKDSGSRNLMVKIFTPFVFGAVGKTSQEEIQDAKELDQLLLIRSSFITSICERKESSEAAKKDTIRCEDASNEPPYVPDYRMIYIPVYYFKYAMLCTGEKTLSGYISDLDDDEFVPYMQTEYIRDRDEHIMNAMRTLLEPSKVPPDVRRKILLTQPQFAPYFDGQ